MKTVELYTDGACSNNQAKDNFGGWGALLIYKDVEKELSGGEARTTNQRMEMKAAIEGLKALKEKCNVNLYSDSAYLINCFIQKWYVKWLQNGWKNSSNKPVENRDLWEELLALVQKHNVNFIKVKGHSDNENNNRVDRLAVEAAKKVALQG